MNFLELMATLGLDKKDYDKGLDDASDKANSFSKTMGNVAKVMSGAVVAGIGAATTATIAGTKAFIDGVSTVAQYGDSIEKTSQKIGVSAQKFQEWDYVMNIAGTSMDNMTMGMKTLTNQLDDAKNGSEDALAKFEALGLSLEDIQTMTREEAFEAAIYGFQGMAESTERAALANDLFGRSGQELTPLFNMTEEETRSLIETANEYGMVMSDDAVNASAAFQDSLTTLQNTMAGLKNNMLSEFLPSFTTVMDGLSAVFSGNTEGGLGMIQEGVGNLADKIAEVAPTFIKVGGTILTALASSIAQNAPILIEAGAEAVGTLIDGVVDNADSILTAAEKVISIFTDKLVDPAKAAKFTQVAINIIVRLANAISQALPQLMPAITAVIVEIVKVLTQPDNLGMLIQCALQLIMAIAEGLLGSIPELVSAIPVIIVNLVSALIDNFPLIVETLFELLGALGVMIIESITGQGVEDIATGFAAIAKFVSDWWNGVLAWFSEKATAFLYSLVEFLNNPKEYIANALNTIKTNAENIINAVKNFVTNVFNNLKTFIPNAIDSMKNAISNGLNAIKDKFTSVFNAAKDIVSRAIDAIKGILSGEISFPQIKLPHFSISGKVDLLATPPEMPKLSVEWYKKAMDAPYLLNSATIFGAANGRYLGGGEAGAEMIYSHDRLMNDIGAVVDARLKNIKLVVPIYIGGKKIDQQIKSVDARNDVVSGGR